MNKLTGSILLAFFSLFLFAYSLNANTTVMNFQKNGKKVHHTEKDGKRVNQCTYCHSDTSIKQTKGMKQGFLKGQANYPKLASIKKCSGSGCHTK